MPAAKKTRNVGIYLRVSTSDQTTKNQRRELKQVAERHGWKVVQIFEDAGISGSRGRDERPAFDAMHKAIARREIDLVAAWSVDRLSRSLSDLVRFLEELQANDCDLYLHQQGLNTSTPSGKAMFQMLGVFSEFERSMIQERVKAGLARARSEGVTLGRPVGASSTDPKKALAARKLLAGGTGILKTAQTVGLGTGTVHKIKREMQSA